MARLFRSQKQIKGLNLPNEPMLKKLRSSFNCRKTINREEELKQESAVAGLTLEEYITQKYIFKCQKTVNKHTKCSQKCPII